MLNRNRSLLALAVSTAASLALRATITPPAGYTVSATAGTATVAVIDDD